MAEQPYPYGVTIGSLPLADLSASINLDKKIPLEDKQATTPRLLSEKIASLIPGGSTITPVTAGQIYNWTLTEGQSKDGIMTTGSGSITVNGKTFALDSATTNNIFALIYVGGKYVILTKDANYTKKNDGTTDLAPTGTPSVAPPIVTANDTANTLSATKAAGTEAGTLQVSVNGGAYSTYTGAISVGDVARAAGYWKFRTLLGGNYSAVVDSPAFTVAGGGGSVAPPILASHDEADTLSAIKATGTEAGTLQVSENGGAYAVYSGTINVGDIARPAGYWKFRTYFNGNYSAVVDSPAFTYSPLPNLIAAVITAVKTGETTAEVTMTSKDVNATTHTVQQSSNGGLTWSNATVTVTGESTWDITGLTPETTYQLRVRSTATGYSPALSNTVSITTDAASVASLYISAIGISGGDATATQDLYENLSVADLDDEVLGLWPFLGADLSKKMYNLMNPANTDAAHRMASTGTNTSVANGIQMSQGSRLNTFYKQQAASIPGYPAIGFTWYIPQYIAGTYSMALADGGSTLVVNFNEASKGAFIKIGGDIAPSYDVYIPIPGETVLKGAWTCQRTLAGKVQIFINGVKIGEKDITGTLEENEFISLANPEAAGKIVGMYMMHKSYAEADVTTLHTLINSFATATGKDV